MVPLGWRSMGARSRAENRDNTLHRNRHSIPERQRTESDQRSIRSIILDPQSQRSRLVQIDGGLAFGESQGGLGRGLTSCALADIGGPARQTDQQLIAGGMARAPVPFIEHET